MVITNVKIVTLNKVIENGYVIISGDKILSVNEGHYQGEDKDIIDGGNKILMPGFIDVHIHGSAGIDFMDAAEEDYKIISTSLFKEGVTGYLATTLTSDLDSLIKVAKNVKKAIKDNPSLIGIHLEGPYINAKYKGAQNELYIRKPDILEFDKLNEASGNNIRYISLAPEVEGSLEFIKHITDRGVVASAGHTDASFNDVEKAIEAGLTNTTHTHNAMSGHHHRKPGVLTAAFYFDALYTEFILDGIHVHPDVIRTSYKIITSDRFFVVTDALKIKHSDIDKFKLFGLDVERRDGAAYLTSGPLAGSLLSMDKALRNLKSYIKDISLIDLMKVSSYNASKALKLSDRGLIEAGRYADLVLLNEDLTVSSTYLRGKKTNY